MNHNGFNTNESVHKPGNHFTCAECKYNVDGCMRPYSHSITNCSGEQRLT